MTPRLPLFAGLGLLCLVAAVMLFLHLRDSGLRPARPQPIPLDPEHSPPMGEVVSVAEATPTLGEAAEEQVDQSLRALAQELAEMCTERPEELVRVIDQAARSRHPSPPVTLVLAIAHAETRGEILDVSEAGAVGLAQATPIAYLQESYSGPIFISTDYLIGARTYFAKKPLGLALVPLCC